MFSDESLINADDESRPGGAMPGVPQLVKSIDADMMIVDERARTFYPDFNGPALGDAGMDLRVMLDEPLTLEPGAVELLGTGLAIHIADPNFVGLLLPRSGLGHKHGIVLGNLTGVMDAGYQGQYMISCWNRSQEPYVVEPGERIAQLVVVPRIQLNPRLVDKFEETTERGAGGFGRSGRT